MTPEQIIAKLKGLSRKVKRLQNVRYQGRDWRLIEDELDKFLRTNLGDDAAWAVHNALNPGRIRVRMQDYPIGDNVDPEWKAERVEAVQTQLHMLVRDLKSGYLVPKEETPTRTSVGPRQPVKPHPRLFISHSGETEAFYRLNRFLKDLGMDPVVAEWLPFRGRQVPHHVRNTMENCQAAIVFATRADQVGERSQPGRGALIETGILQERFGEKVVYLVEEAAEFGPMADNFACESFTQDCLERAFHRIVVELKAHGLI